MKLNAAWMIIIAMVLWALPAVNFAQEAADSAPIVMLKQTSQELLKALKQNKADIQHNQRALYRIVNTILIPHVDEESMAQHVVGREYWMNASPEDRRLFIDEFVKVVVRTYAAALTSYTDQKVVFLPLRGGITGQQQVEVDSQIIQSNGTVDVKYRLILLGNVWKVRDFSVDNVSLVQNYHAQFAEVLAQKGFAGLLQQLGEHNRQHAG